MTLRLRAAAYSPNAARLGILPTPQGLSGSMVLGDVGAFSIAYPLDGPKSPWLASACEVALEVSYDDGQTWVEPDNARFLRLRRKGDQVDAPNVVTYEGPSYLWLLDKSPVLPEGQLNAEGKRAFLTATVGTIIRTLVQEAQTRGELPGLTVGTFSAATDSAGVAWGTVVTIYYDPGTSYLTILRNLADQGLCDFTMSGRALKVYKGSTVMATASGATLLKGRDLTEAPYAGTLEGIASHAFLLGDGGKTFERTNPSAPTPWGRWTTFISQGGVSDTGTMTVLTDATLALASDERVENTYGLDFSRAKALPFRDYNLGQMIAVKAGDDVPESLRLRQITLTRDEKGTVQGNVVLNDRFLENDVSQSRRIQGITGGTTVDGGTGGRPDQRGDRTTPKAPTGLTSGSAAYLDDAGKVWALVTLDWADVTENTDGTAITDLAYYEVFYRFASGGAWTSAGTTTASTFSKGGFQANTGYDFRVEAVDNAAIPHRSAPSLVITDVTQADATAPGKPSTPTASAYLGQLLLRWDGLLDSGGTPPLDYARAEFHLSTAAAFVPSAATLVGTTSSRAGGSTVITGLTYGTAYYAKVVLYDNTGNASPASDAATATPVKMGGIDLDTGAVGYDALAFKQSGNQVPDGTFEDVQYRTNLQQTAGLLVPPMEAGWSLVSDVANSVSGSWALRLNTAASGAAQRNVRLLGTLGLQVPGDVGTKDAMRVSPGEKWLLRFQAKGTGGNAKVGMFWTTYDADGTFLSFVGINYWTPTGAFATYSAAATMPARAAFAKPHLSTTSDSTTGMVYVDDVEVRPIIGTLLVDDAAITNAKIASMAVDKITAGALTAAITVSGRIATGLTGARVEINDQGLKQYNASGVLTVDIPVSGGATFGGTMRTGTTGARVEVKPGGSGGQVELYSGYVSETAPGYLSTVVTGDAPASNATIYLVSPKRNADPVATLALQSADADGASAAAFYLDRGDLQIYGKPAGAYGGAIHFRNIGAGGANWGSVMRYGSGIRLHSNNGYAVLSSTFRAWVLADTEAHIQSPDIRIIGATTHSGGALTLSDTYARTATFAANLGIATAPLGVVYRITSSARYKVEIRDEEVPLEAVKALRPRSYVDRGQWEDNGGDSTGLKRHLGLIAEEVAAIPGLGDLLVPRDGEGRPESVDYDRVAVTLLPWLHDLERRLEALESRA